MNTVFVTSSRADFGLIRPIIQYFFGRDEGVVRLICVGAAVSLSEEYLRSGIGEFEIVKLGSGCHAIAHRNALEVVGDLADTMHHVSVFLAEHQHEVDWLFLPGDRFEIFATAIAGYYQNIPIVHLFGGDRSTGGHLDDNTRHAITKLAHVHFSVCEDSYQRLLRMGEEDWRVFNVGSPVVESINEVLAQKEFTLDLLIRPRLYNVICTYHPITTESEAAGRQFASLLRAFDLIAERLDVSWIITYPNNEYGSGDIIQNIKGLQGKSNYFVFESLGWHDYLAVLSKCDAVVGNSSSGLLEAPIVGLPTLDVGTRQKGRYAPASVVRCESYDPIVIAEKLQGILLGHSPVTVAHPYGDGRTSQRIHAILSQLRTHQARTALLQKTITF